MHYSTLAAIRRVANGIVVRRYDYFNIVVRFRAHRAVNSTTTDIHVAVADIHAEIRGGRITLEETVQRLHQLSQR